MAYLPKHSSRTLTVFSYEKLSITAMTGYKVMVVNIIIALIVGFEAGFNLEHSLNNHDCLKSQAVYERAVQYFKEDINDSAADELLMADEYRKFEFYMQMKDTCHSY